MRETIYPMHDHMKWVISNLIS